MSSSDSMGSDAQFDMMLANDVQYWEDQQKDAEKKKKDAEKAKRKQEDALVERITNRVLAHTRLVNQPQLKGTAMSSTATPGTTPNAIAPFETRYKDSIEGVTFSVTMGVTLQAAPYQTIKVDQVMSVRLREQALTDPALVEKMKTELRTELMQRLYADVGYLSQNFDQLSGIARH